MALIEALCNTSSFSTPINKLQIISASFTSAPPIKQSRQWLYRPAAVVRAAVLTASRAGDVQGTLYDLLELSPNVGVADIKQAYRRMAKRYHPDVLPSTGHLQAVEESTRRFIDIQQAYETLSDPRTRAVYDHAVAMGRGAPSGSATGRCMSRNDMQDNQLSDWKSQWESQLCELKRRSSMKGAAKKTESWSARVRSIYKADGFCEYA